MHRLARTLSALSAAALLAAALPAAAGDPDRLITGDVFPRMPDLISRDLVPPPLDLATTQVRPGQSLYLAPRPEPVPRDEYVDATAALGAGGCLEVRGDECLALLGETDIQVWIDQPGLGREDGFDPYD
jgi:hypothetical protein